MRTTKGGENIFVDCGFPPAEAENLRIRAKMMMALTDYIQERKITQSRAARIMGVSQPRISGLMRGKIGLFRIDTLANMVTAAGLKVDVDIAAGRPRACRGDQGRYHVRREDAVHHLRRGPHGGSYQRA
jgi:predicted XRE-type DNA-binding protein